MTETISIIPKPVTLEPGEGHFTLDAETALAASIELTPLAEQLAATLRPATGFALPVQTGGSENSIRLVLDDGLVHLGDEGYQLDVKSSGVRLAAAAEAGLFYAGQSLRQLLPTAIFADTSVDDVEWIVPAVRIEDTPRFGWRGAMLDVGRYFLPVDFVLKFIDLLALHKMNRFHWHLTEDQGWRIEIKRYPRLTTHGAMRPYTVIGHQNDRPLRYDDVPHGGFYTQDEIRQVVAYAQERHVVVVPEIDMPGHMDAAISAYPELGNLPMLLQPRCIWDISQHILNPQESTIQFMFGVLEEVMELFPGDYIHVGGDEALKREWQESRAAQERMAELGLSSEDELQSWFIGRMDAFIAEHGRRLIGWDEILEGGLAENAAVMSWRGMDGGIFAAQAGHDVVMAPTTHTYLDYLQGKKEDEPLGIGNFIPLEKAYEFEPVPDVLSEEEAAHILGGQCQLWTEYMPTGDHVEYMTFPRLCATAEAVWSEQDQRDYGDFVERLSPHLGRLNVLDVKYRALD